MGIFSNLIVMLGLDDKGFSSGLKKAKKETTLFSKGMKKLGGAIAGAFAVGKIVNFGRELVKRRTEAEGVNAAFERLPDNIALMQQLQAATRGTVSELELKKSAVQWKNFGLDLGKMSSFMEFARRTAKDTGLSVEYLTQSIVTGLGRKSPLILDNLGISVTELRDEIKKTGDFVTAAANIANKRMSEMGPEIETTGEKVAKMSAAWENFKTALSDNVSLFDSVFDSLAKGLDKITVRLKSSVSLMDQLAAGGVDVVKNEIEAMSEASKEFGIQKKNLDAMKDQNKALEIQKKQMDEITKQVEIYTKKQEEASNVSLSNDEVRQATRMAGGNYMAQQQFLQLATRRKRYKLFTPEDEKELKYYQSLLSELKKDSVIRSEAILKSNIKEPEKVLGIIDKINNEIKDIETKKLDPKTNISEIQAYNKEIERLKFQLNEINNGIQTITPRGLGGGMSEGGGFEADKIRQRARDFSNAADDYVAGVKEKQLNIGDAMRGFTTSAVASLGTAIGSGDFSNLGNAILGQFGSFLMQLGEMMVAYGGLWQGFNIVSSNPLSAPLAIGLGLAAIAAGAAFSAMASKSPQQSGGGISGGQSYGGGDNTSNTALFNRAGQTVSGYGQGRQSNTVDFKIKGQDLVATMNRNQLKASI